MAPGSAGNPPDEHSQVGSVLGGGADAAPRVLLTAGFCCSHPFADDCAISWTPPGIPTLQGTAWTPRLATAGPPSHLSAGL